MGALLAQRGIFTPTAMIIAQVIIITRLMASITYQAMRARWAEHHGDA